MMEMCHLLFDQKLSVFPNTFQHVPFIGRYCGSDRFTIMGLYRK